MPAIRYPRAVSLAPPSPRPISWPALALATAIAIAIAACGPDATSIEVFRDAIDAIDAADAIDAIDAPDTGDANQSDGIGDSDATLAQCLLDEECAHLDDCCIYGRCIAGECSARWRIDCCAELGPCASSSALHTANCVDTCTASGCVPALILPQAPCGEYAWGLDLTEDGGAYDQLLIRDAAPSDRVTWSRTVRRTLDGRPALYAGDALCPTYYNGPLSDDCRASSAMAAPVDISVDLPRVSLPADRPTVAEIWLWLDLEPPTLPTPPPQAGDTPPGGATFDRLNVSAIIDSGAAVQRWRSDETPHPARAWFPILIDLSDLGGQTISLRFSLTTGDGRSNDYEGVYIGAAGLRHPCLGDLICPQDATCTTSMTVDISGTGDTLCIASPSQPGAACVPCSADEDCEAPPPCARAACDLSVGHCVPTAPDASAATCCAEYHRATLGGDFDDQDSAALWGISADPQSVDSPANAADLEPDDEIAPGWHLSTLRSSTGSHSLRFGHPDLPVISASNEPASGTVIGPPLTVPADGVLSWYLWLSTEWDGGSLANNPLGLDRLDLIAIIELDLPASAAPIPLGETILWRSDQISGTTNGQWLPLTLDISHLAGRTIRLAWRFDTVDGYNNDGEGVYIDAIGLDGLCVAPL